MADEGAKTGGERRIVPIEMRGNQHRRRAFEDVAEQRRRGQALAARAQHIGGADITGADGAHVRPARRARQDQAKGNGAEQVAKQDGECDCHTSS